MAMTIDYDAVIADLEARRATFNQATDQAIIGIRQILSLSTGAGMVAALADATNGADFFGLGLVDAVKKLLRQSRRKMSNKEIADALEKGGFIHTSKDFSNTVGTALWRAEKDGDAGLFRQGRFWLLDEWAPGRRKGRTEDPGDIEVESANDPPPPNDP